MGQSEHVWYYIVEGLLGTTENVGPISEGEMVSLARGAKIKRETLVSSPTRTNGGFLPAHQVKGLLRAFEIGEQERKDQKEREARERRELQEAKIAERTAREEQRAAERKAREEERAKQQAIVFQQQAGGNIGVIPANQAVVDPRSQPGVHALSSPTLVNVQVQQPSHAAHSLGISSMILGILSLFVCWLPFVGFFFAGLGLVLGVVGLVLALTRHGTGIGFSIAGSAISSVSVIFGFVYVSTLMDIANRTNSPNSQSGSSLVTSASKGSEDAKEKLAYIRDHLALYEVEAKYFSTYSDDQVAGVLFKLKNNGDRVLEKVEVTVHFKDADGGVIFEESFLPVLVTEYSFGDNKPLKPGHIWQIERGKFYTAKSVPSEWAEGAVDVEVTDIRFAELQAGE
jgi:hypothetical protein